MNAPGFPALLWRHPDLTVRGEVADLPDEGPDRRVQLGQGEPGLPGADFLHPVTHVLARHRRPVAALVGWPDAGERLDIEELLTDGGDGDPGL